MLVVGIKVQSGGSPGQQFRSQLGGVLDADRVLAFRRLGRYQPCVQILRHLLLHQLNHAGEPGGRDDGHDARKDAHSDAGLAGERDEAQVLFGVEK